MIPLSEAQAYVLQGCTPLGAAPTDSSQALGLVTAEPIMCNEFVPPFKNTAVDGYAVMAADTKAAPVDLQVIGAIAAGEAPSTPLTPGTAIRIMTGAPLPDGADAIVMVEDFSSLVSLLAVSMRSESSFSFFPPGNDICPLCTPGYLFLSINGK